MRTKKIHTRFRGPDTIFEYWHQEDMTQMERDSGLRDPMS